MMSLSHFYHKQGFWCFAWSRSHKIQVNLQNPGEVCPENSQEIGRFFHEFAPKNPAKFEFFFHDLSEALHKGTFKKFFTG